MRWKKHTGTASTGVEIAKHCQQRRLVEVEKTNRAHAGIATGCGGVIGRGELMEARGGVVDGTIGDPTLFTRRTVSGLRLPRDIKVSAVPGGTIRTVSGLWDPPRTARTERASAAAELSGWLLSRSPKFSSKFVPDALTSRNVSAGIRAVGTGVRFHTLDLYE